MPLNLTVKMKDGVPVLDQAREAIASVESDGSGGYSAIGPKTKKGDRAYGRYQVMGANIPEWTRQAVGRAMTPQEFLASPEAQDAVFNKIFGGYIEKHGNPQDAASMWFSGRPLAQAGGRQDILGTNPEQYVNKFNSALGADPLASGGVGRFGMATPPSMVQPVGDVVDAREKFRGRTPMGEVMGTPMFGPRAGGSSGSFGSKWRDPAAVDKYGVQSGLRPGSLQPAPPPTAEVMPMQRPVRPAVADSAIKQPMKQSSATSWLYGQQAAKLNLPQRIADAVKKNENKPEFIQSLRAWMAKIDKADVNSQLHAMESLSRTLQTFGY